MAFDQDSLHPKINRDHRLPLGLRAEHFAIVLELRIAVGMMQPTSALRVDCRL